MNFQVSTALFNGARLVLEMDFAEFRVCLSSALKLQGSTEGISIVGCNFDYKSQKLE